MKLAVSIPPLLVLAIWSMACLWIDGPESRAAAGLLALGFAAATVGVVIRASADNGSNADITVEGNVYSSDIDSADHVIVET